MEVTLPFDLNGRDPNNLSAYYFDEESLELTEMACTYTEVNGQGYVTFVTSHFSGYIVSETLLLDNYPVEVYLYAVLVFVVVLLGAAIVARRYCREDL